MFRKLLKYLRSLLIGTIWSCLFLILAQLLMWNVWHFNLFSARSWHTIGWFWQSGGVIRTASDYIFLFSILFLPFFWIIGWIIFNRLNYLSIILFPLLAYNRYIIKKYGHDSKRVILRNLKSSQKAIEEIKQKLESIKPEAPKEVGSIRQELQKKLKSSLK